MRAPRRPLLALASLLVCLVVGARAAEAHGIWGHIHVTGWALENLPPGEVRDFFAHPDVFNAALFGAAFTDSGYFPQGPPLSDISRAYGEHTHWEPFIEDFIAWIRANDPPPWDDLESRQRVAFLIGAASHGLQDELFDSLFLDQVDENDDGGQDEADPGTDGALAVDDHLRFIPYPWVPYDTLVELYERLDAGVTRRSIEQSVQAMTFAYVRDGGWLVAEGLAEQYLGRIPWTAAHYMDPDIPGSLRAEINPTAAHVLAIWDRLHGTFDPNHVVVATYPAVPYRLRSHETGTVNSTVTLVFGAGVKRAEVESIWFAAAAPDADGADGSGEGVGEGSGEAVPHSLTGTRWGSAWPRLVRLRPTLPLTPGGWYRAGMPAGVTLINGATVSQDFEFTFQVECTEVEGDCAPIDVTPPTIDTPLDFPEEPSDAEGEEVGIPDEADTDVNLADDYVWTDTDEPDVTPDTTPDAGDEVDTTLTDAAPDDASEGETAARGGGGCAVGASRAPSGLSLLLVALVVALRRSTARRTSRA